jgi:hypothetical protein
MEVSLLDRNGRYLGKTRTDANGQYTFYTGYEGDATITFKPDNQTPRSGGVTDDATDDNNDIETAAGKTAIFEITASPAGTYHIDGAFEDGAPNVEQLDLTINGTVPAVDYDVELNDTSVNLPSGGAFSLTTTVPAGTEYINLIATDNATGAQTIRRVNVQHVQSGSN